MKIILENEQAVDIAVEVTLLTACHPIITDISLIASVI